MRGRDAIAGGETNHPGPDRPDDAGKLMAEPNPGGLLRTCQFRQVRSA